MSDESRMREIFRSCDKAFCEGRFEEVGQQMDTLDLAQLGLNLTVGWLSATYPATRQLGDYRVRFVARVEPFLIAQIGAERTANILSRLR